jgi:hypothetical protein
MAGMAGFGEDSRRYLCSHLVTLVFSGQRRVVNLEEICRTGACLESDDSVPAGVPVEMRTEAVRFQGTVTEVEEHDLGWRIELEFSPLTPWCVEHFRPQHLLDPSALEG